MDAWETPMEVDSRGFTFVELLIVLVVSGILAAMAAANYGALQKRAREASVKSNMHVFQVATEDYGVRNGNTYPANASQAAALLTQGGSTFRNPFDRTTGSNKAWRDRPDLGTPADHGIDAHGHRGLRRFRGHEIPDQGPRGVRRHVAHPHERPVDATDRFRGRARAGSGRPARPAPARARGGRRP